jgi:uncharacterized glyoxalase superfamily protein PhnB
MTDTTTGVQAEIQIVSAVPTFLVADVGSTARWYAQNLGFQTGGHVPDDEPFVYASLYRGHAEIMLLNLPGYQKPDLTDLRPHGLWEAYFRMRGVRALYESMRGQPFIKMPLKKQWYGDWEFEVRDPNGYVLVFGGDADL